MTTHQAILCAGKGLKYADSLKIKHIINWMKGKQRCNIHVHVMIQFSKFWKNGLKVLHTRSYINCKNIKLLKSISIIKTVSDIQTSLFCKFMQGSAEKANNIGYKSYSNCKYLLLKMFRDTTIKYVFYLYVFSRNVRITIFTRFFTIKTIGLQSRVYIPRNKQTSSSFLKPLLNKVHVLYNESLPHMLFYILKFRKKNYEGC